MREPDHPLLAPYKAAILAAEKPTAEITLEPCGNLTLSQSKIGGLPYLPPDAEYPRNSYGQPLTLLAQINFAEMPPLPDFPTSGILQWFIDLHGFFVDEALRYLGDMLDERRNRRAECWVIVHGKGRNSPHYDRAPLKQAVLDLLLRHPAVNALATIIDSDGYSGAVSVEIKEAMRVRRH